MNQPISFKPLILIALVLTCFALLPTAKAQLPWPAAGGRYPFSNTAKGTKKAIQEEEAAKSAAGRETRVGAPFDFPGPNAGGTFITFDAPGAVFGTFPSGINPAGVIVGFFFDVNFGVHGFVRAPAGIITTIDVPGTYGSTALFGINPAGASTGTFADVNFVIHDFLRAPDGSITTFDVPGNVNGTIFSTINPAGQITGTFFDVNLVLHGFVRAPDGTITTIDVPGALNGTNALALNPRGVIAGSYTDPNFVGHGFLRASNGTLTTFDAPPPNGLTIETFAPFSFGPDLSITAQGAITGTYFELIPGNPFGGNFRVFVRATDGTFTTFDAATYPPCCIFSFPSGMNPAGTITGSFNDGFTINHGFLRTSDGTITTFDVPGAGTGFNQGTAPLGITPDGVIMGLYIDANYGHHGFVRIP